MREREKLIKEIRYRARSLGMLEVYRLVEEKYLHRLEEMDTKELKELLVLLSLDERSLWKKLTGDS